MGKFNEKIRKFTYGRYGSDELSRFLSVLAIILCLLSYFLKNINEITNLVSSICFYVAIFLLLICIFRSLSKNIVARRKEQTLYLRIRNKIVSPFKLMKQKFKDRKTHNYYKCPHCKTIIRINKPNKGKIIEIHCPKCGKDFEKRT